LHDSRYMHLSLVSRAL